MFEKFTDQARRVVVLAQEEARMLDHNYIGTEHILLGLLHDGEGVAVEALEAQGVSLDAVRERVEERIGRGSQQLSGHIPFTPRAKKVLELSLREALDLGTSYIGTEHILLGLIHEGSGVAAQVLVELGADTDRTRQEVMQRVGGESAPERRRSSASVGGQPTQFEVIVSRLNSIDARLAGIERHLGIAAGEPAPAAEAAGPGDEAPPEEEAPPEAG